MKLLNLEGFCQLPENREAVNGYLSVSSLSSALTNNYGVSLINDISSYGSLSSAQRTTLTVYGTQRTGLAIKESGRVAYTIPLPDISKAAVQLGFRLTLADGEKYNSGSLYLIRVCGCDIATPYPKEAASYYYEVFVSWNGSQAAIEVYCNGVLSRTYSTTLSDTTRATIVIGGVNYNYVFAQNSTGTLMLGDMYLATISYDEKNTACAEPQGSVEVRYSEVTQFEGGRAENLLGNDIVTGLNSNDSSLGCLMLGASTDAAIATFASVDNSENNLIGAVASISYRTSASPNNYLAWGINCEDNEGEIIEDTDLNADQASWTTVHQSITRQADSEPTLPSGTLTFSVSLYNRKATPDNQKARRSLMMARSMNAPQAMSVAEEDVMEASDDETEDNTDNKAQELRNENKVT